MLESLRRIRRACVATILLVGAQTTVFAEAIPLLILHTNDLHDHVRADYDGSGGLAFVSGYIQEILSRRDDVLVLDAGDVMEKGDLAVFLDKSRTMYKAMNRIGYDAIAPGNHDDAFGDAHLMSCAQLAPDVQVLAINLLQNDGTTLFSPSTILERNGLRIGVIGVFKPRDENALSLDHTGEHSLFVPKIESSLGALHPFFSCARRTFRRADQRFRCR